MRTRPRPLAEGSIGRALEGDTEAYVEARDAAVAMLETVGAGVESGAAAGGGEGAGRATRSIGTSWAGGCGWSRRCCATSACCTRAPTTGRSRTAT